MLISTKIFIALVFHYGHSIFHLALFALNSTLSDNNILICLVFFFWFVHIPCTYFPMFEFSIFQSQYIVKISQINNPYNVIKKIKTQ